MDLKCAAQDGWCTRTFEVWHSPLSPCMTYNFRSKVIPTVSLLEYRKMVSRMKDDAGASLGALTEHRDQ